MGVKSEERRELWWKMNESHGGRMGVKTEGRGGEEGGETEEYLRTVNRVRQGRTSGTRHSFFCGLRGSISEVDPANVMWESQLQITAETFTTEPAEAPPSPSKLSRKKPLQLLLSRPASQAITHDEVGRFAATKSEKSKKHFLLR